MGINTNTKGFIVLIPWILPLYVILPYSFIATGFRGLAWVWQAAYLPFWAMLFFQLFLAIVTSTLFYRLNELGNTLFRVGIAAAHRLSHDPDASTGCLLMRRASSPAADRADG